VRNGPAILVVDDDASLGAALREFLTNEGYEAVVAQSGAEALVMHAANPTISLALVDLIMPAMDGLAVTEALRARDPDMAVVIMTGYGTIETAIEAIKKGAEDYITKPFDYEALRKKIARLMEVMELRQRVTQLEGHLERHSCFENIISVSSGMERMLERARLAAATDAPVLIVGETGTGKEMLARAIHQASRRARLPFVAVNSGALPRDLVESELFNFRRGAGASADTDSRSLFSAASGGTMFLDDIGETPNDVQVKLLRVLEERELRVLGSSNAVHVDVRVISATHRSLHDLRKKFLREDLFFRVATVVLQVPPLRDRREDILVLSQHFAARLTRKYGRQISLARNAVELLLAYPFPGNVRELESLIESSAATSADHPQVITAKDLAPLLNSHASEPPSGMSSSVSLEQMERLTIEQALRLAEGNRTKAASLLGISRDTLYRKMRQYHH
jgi:DNA-binding NtrC family response regulator